MGAMKARLLAKRGEHDPQDQEEIEDDDGSLAVLVGFEASMPGEESSGQERGAHEELKDEI